MRDRWFNGLRALAVIDASGSHKPNLTHGICPACFDQVNAQADRERRA